MVHAHIAVPVLEHNFLEMRELGNLANPRLRECRLVIDKAVGRAVEGIAKVPHGSKHNLGAVAVLLVPVAAAVERLGVVEQLLREVEAREGIGVDIFFPTVVGLVVHIDGSVGGIDKPGEVGALLIAKQFGRLVGRPYAVAVALHGANLLLFQIVVNLHQPSAGDEKAVSLIVGLLGDVDAVGLHANYLGEHVKPQIVTV